MEENTQQNASPNFGVKTNWRERVKPEWLYINPEAVTKGLISRDTPIEDADDRFLCIKLAGLRELAQERGYSVVDYEIVSASADYVAMKCEIGWDETETEGECFFASTADAHINNTKDFCQNFLCAIAENRAFSRCVRNFLNISIVSDAELGDMKKKGNDVSAADGPAVEQLNMHAKLQEAMDDLGVTFGALKKKLTEEGWPGIESVADVGGFSSFDAAKLTNRLRKANKKGAK